MEFALILPAILLLVVGMSSSARAWNLHQVMTDAAREARDARCRQLGDGSGFGQRPLALALAQFGGEFPATPASCRAPRYAYRQLQAVGANITIQLSLPYRFFILPGMSITMRTAFTMRNE